MIYDFNLAYPYIFICLVLTLLLFAGYRWLFWQPTYYGTSLTTYFKKQKLIGARHISSYILFGLRFLALFLLILATARPQKIDPKSKVQTDGIDIILVLDVSQSMELADDLNDFTTRIAIAKKEAINFIKRREQDPIGLVLFGRYALSRCPLTLDKNVLSNIIEKIEIGEIDPGGTSLAVGMMTAVNRLKKSQAKSRIMIVLTDGQPTPGDLDPAIVIDIAKKLDIKIYTIGIGSKDGGFFNHPIFGPIRQGEVFDHKLLAQIATQTGGQFFEAKNITDMQQVYRKIDQLEKTSSQSTVFTKKIEYFGLFIKLGLFVLICELILAYFIWFGL